jgi:hypothetical protein
MLQYTKRQTHCAMPAASHARKEPQSQTKGIDHHSSKHAQDIIHNTEIKIEEIQGLQTKLLLVYSDS